MNLEDIEGEAGSVFSQTRLDSCEVPNFHTLTLRLLGRAPEIVPISAVPGDACLAVVNGESRIFLRKGLSKSRARFAVAHELAHFVLGIDSTDRDNEDACDALAACLVVPRRAFRLALGENMKWRELAEKFHASESCVALRYGEVTDVPLALIAPSRVRVRGAEFVWPANFAPRRGIKRSRLEDDRRRTVVRAVDV